MNSASWNERYAANDLVWSLEANRWVVEVASDLEPGRALDLAAGEGRNAIWLVEQGWEAKAVDFSEVAIERAKALAEARLGERMPAFSATVGDATESQGAGFDLVLFSYLHLPKDEWRKALAAGVESCTQGGRVLVIGHARRNLTEGIGGPQNPAILYDPEHVTALLEGLPVEVERAELGRREVQTDDGPRVALDTVVVARRLD
ncbi:MAG TPA: class I SAM-dependent methyltransferase [Propionibacterium sp.]|jgi:SAM-dependent methyltransferase|nr:class I SAM-dependent methyltransferase [Propionibacterium sp.]